jgi:glycerophosphoryl diester phosphodiesterase
MADRRQVLQMGALVVGAAAGGTVALAIPAQAHGRLGPGHAGRHTLVIGHRGAAGYRPEHTLASYELAARMGADFIEPDLVSTKDGVLVARHDLEISDSTDVATRPEFAGRRRTLLLYGNKVTGWFAQDFTLAELKTLRAVETMPTVRQRNTMYNGYFQIPTLQEVLDLRARLSKELGRPIGVYPETKHPTYFRSIGLPLEPTLVRILRQNNLDRVDAPVFVQSFEAHNLHALRDEYGLRVPLIFLASITGHPASDPQTYADYLTPAGLAGLAKFADGIGPDKSQVIPRRADNTLGQPTSLVADAHRAGLVVHAYTFQAENRFLPADYQVGGDPNAYGRAVEEQAAFLRAGVDGLFTDQADIGVLARSRAFAKP